MSTLLAVTSHPGQPATSVDVWSLWAWDPSVLVGCAALLICYVWLLKGWSARQFYTFFAGVLVLLLALVSPIDTLGDNYLFSAHMLQHLLLILVVPPLLLLGTPAAFFRSILRNPVVRHVERVLRNPLLAWALAIGTLCAWHLPALYNTALEDEGVHIVQHLCFLITSVIFWWPVLSPIEESRLPALGAVPYLFTAALANALLGIYFTFAPPGLYPAYMRPDDGLGLLSALRGEWGLSPAADQQFGGLLMWVPGGLAYLAAIFGVLARWYASSEDDDPVAEGAIRLSQPLPSEESR
jgi:cytochrome c oxidase assembly factor CtaG